MNLSRRSFLRGLLSLAALAPLARIPRAEEGDACPVPWKFSRTEISWTSQEITLNRPPIEEFTEMWERPPPSTFKGLVDENVRPRYALERLLS